MCHDNLVFSSLQWSLIFHQSPVNPLVLVYDCTSLVLHLIENCSCLKFQVFAFFFLEMFIDRNYYI